MAKGGSQLAQLKSHVRSAGISDRRQQSNASKKRKRGQAASERDEAAARREALARISSDTKFNPFDEKVTRVKHDVLGKKVKGAVGRPALAKQGGLAQRRAMLLPEYQNRNKSGTFIDRRFGEADDNLTPEERMLERFTKEKQRQAKGKKAAFFNLNDDDGLGQEEELTHFGRSLSAMGNLPELSMIDDDAGQIDNATTSADHFGGFEAESADPDRQKSKAEVMREVMAKSKLHKMERQQMRDADDELRAQLDDELGDIRGLLMAGPSKPSQPNDDATKPSKPAGGDYDQFVRELAFERRAKPQDRLKTEEELAEEEAEQLRKAEEARLRRMRGEDVDDEGGAKPSGKRRVAQGDDLDDDLDIDGQTAAEQYGLGGGLGVATEDDDGDDEGAPGEEDEDDGDDGDEDSSEGEQDSALEDEGFGETLEGDAGEGSEHQDLNVTARKTRKRGSAGKLASRSAQAASEDVVVPFTFTCPTSHADFLDILDEHSLEPRHVPLVVKRIRALHHPSLAEDNKFRLQGFLGVLLDHCLYSASQAVSAKGEQRRSHLAVVDFLLKPIFELTQKYPIPAAQHFVEKLSLMERNLNRGLAKGALLPEARTWPGAAELTLLRVTGLIWPTSDQNHPVTTPLALLSAHYLAHSRVRSYTDLASGLYLTSLVAQQQSEAKRMVPEALNFLQSAVTLLSPLDKKGKDVAREVCSDYAIAVPDFGEAHAAQLSLSAVAKQQQQRDLPQPEKPALFDLLGGGGDASSGQAQTAVDLLGLTLSLIDEFSGLYQGTGAYIELFEPFRLVLEAVSPARLPSQLSLQLSTLLSQLGSRLQTAQEHRQPLRLHAHRAIPLASFIPKFDEGGRSRGGAAAWDPDAARAEAAKLRALVKKERKGAVRELRKDSQFLATEKAEQRRREEDEYKRKMGRIVAGLGEERSEEKQLARDKARIRKRAGK